MAQTFKLRPLDGLIWVAALLGLAFLYGYLWAPSGQAASLNVLVDNQSVLTVPLNRNEQYTVAGRLGESVIEVRNGQARFVSSPCRNQVCVHHGWASHRGELLACLPNRIALVLDGDAPEGPMIDAVNF